MPLDPSPDNHLIAIKNLTTVSSHGSGLLSVLKSVTREIIDTMGYGRVIIAVKDKKSYVLRFRIGKDREITGKEFTKLLRSIPPVSLAPDSKGRLSVLAWSFRNGQELSVADAHHYDFMTDQTFQDQELVSRFGLGSYVIAPISFRGDSLGILIVDNKYISRPLTEYDRRVISTIADHLSVCIINVEILNKLKKSNRKLQETNKELASSQRQYRQFVERGPDAVFILQDHRFVFVNKMFHKMFGYDEIEIIGKEFIEFLAPESRKSAVKMYDDALSGIRVSDEYEYSVIRKDGTKVAVWMKTTFTRVKDRLGLLCFAHDITEKKRAESELRQAKAYLENILESANDLIYILDLEGMFTYVNKKFEEFGYDPRELIGRSFLDILSPAHKGERFRKTITTGIKQVYELEMVEKGSERIRNVVVSTSPLTDESGATRGVLVLGKDITDRKRAEEELRRMSITDSLTELFNQRHFFQKIREETERARRMSYPICLMIFDIDNFKRYNDTRGHLAGNEILKTIGRIIQSTIRTTMDTAFRYGGDEFAIILPNTTLPDVKIVAYRIKEMTDENLEGLTISIGISSMSEHGSVEDFINAADKAMYTAKSMGRQAVVIHSPDSSYPT
ncbi:MAG: diguanylate cyclase [Deltaproteobacteria bacterium]|nr:diguanylate cyclase [Candidatus Zymogenaceae bacterium]